MHKIFYLLFLGALASQAQQLYPYSDGQKWGFTNEKLEIVVAPQFDDNPRLVKGNFAIVRQNAKFGIVDKKGKTIFPVQYDLIADLNGETFQAMLNNKYVFLNAKKGKQVSDLVFDDVKQYCECPENIAVVEQNKKRGFFSIATGKFISGTLYDNASFASYYPPHSSLKVIPRLGIVTKDNKQGVLNLATGTLLINIQHQSVDVDIIDGKETLRCYNFGKTHLEGTYFDLTGKEIKDVEEYAEVAGETYSEPATASAESEEEEQEPSEDLYAAGSVGGDGTWKITIEKTTSAGKEVLYTHDVHGYYVVSKVYYNPQEGASTARLRGVKTDPTIIHEILDIKGNVLTQLKYDQFEYIDGYYIVRQDGLAGIVTKDFVVIKKPTVKWVRTYDQTLNAWLIEMPSGQEGYMDKSGKIFIPGI